MIDAFALVVGMAIVFVFFSFLIWKELRNIHKTMNSRLSELLQTTKTLARAEGFKAGQEDHLQALRDFRE